MANRGIERDFEANDPIVAANDTNHDEPVAEVPLERVGTESELNSAKVVDKAFIRDKYDEKHPGKEANVRITSSGSNSISSNSLKKLEKTETDTQQTHSRRRWLSLRSRHIPPVPKERMITREAQAGIFSMYSFQWMQPLMYTGYQRPLELNDIWLVNPKRRADILAEKVMTSFNRRVEKGDKRPLLGALHETLFFEFWLGGTCQLISSIVQVINPFILRYIITFSEEAYDAVHTGTPAPSIGRGVGLVIGVTVLQMIQSGCTNQFLYRGQINGGQARAALISIIFDKSMSISGRAKARGKVPVPGGEALPSGIKPGSVEEKNWFQKRLGMSNKEKKARAKKAEDANDQGWANGRIVNLMSVDTYRIDQASDFGWETSFLERIEAVRSKEIRSIQWLLAVRNGINAVAMSMPVFASMLAFITYSLTSHGLNPAFIFSSLALFNSLRLPLNLLPMVIGQVVDAGSSVERIQEFLMAEDAKDECEWDMDNDNAIEVRKAAFTWERTPPKAVEQKTAKQEKSDKAAAKKSKKENEQLAKAGLPSAEKEEESSNDVQGNPQEEKPPFEIKDIDFSVGRNELVAVIGGVGSGKSSLLAALAGDMRKTDGLVTMGATRAFCPQYAWIQNATLRDNILFGKDMDDKWYNQVIDACALRPDLEMLPSGDMTEIGERGITVSGGQKQRLNIARAIYFDSDIILMDDPLSAVDAHVGRHIMDQAICGLLANKCRILATHQLWVLSRCDRVIWMDEGKIIAVDTFDSLMASNEEFVKLIANNAQEEQAEEIAHVNDDEVAEEKKEATKHHEGKKPAAALMQAEERAVKGVSTDVYLAYAKASGSLLVVPLCFILLVLSSGGNIVTSLWLSWWTDDNFGYAKGVYIGGYAALGFMQAFFMFVFSVALSVFGTQSSKVMLHKALTRVLRAPMSFFDTTPLGRITNRFSKDVDTADNVLTDAIRFFCMTMGQIISVFILILVYYYYFAAALGPLLALFLFAAGFYRASAREVKRHEAVLRSTVFSRFSEGVSGIATIRAYGLQKTFSKSIRDAVDEMDSAYFLTYANQRWLSFRLDAIGNLLVFVLGMLVVTSRFTVSPSIGGLVLSYILSIVQMIQFTVRQLAEVENNMNSIERLHYYGTQLEEEPPLHLNSVDPSWPQHGEIIFENVQMRYREGLPLVLRGLSMHVRGGERIGVVGRTGAGKSSIMSTLFRLVELSGGSIFIDGINTQTVGLADLRSRLAIIPQDPTLFKGTIRSNLDPFNKFNDLQLWSALRQADLVGAETTLADNKGSILNLDSPVEEEGLNFSLGQRQLMALARALVRGSQIIVCDEATSSVDMETDNRIQATMGKAFKGKTMLCIAHRLKTIISYDRICVMDQGLIAELDTPLALYDQGGIFYQMCKKSSISREDILMPVEEYFAPVQ